MTQSDLFVESEPAPSPKRYDLWIAGAVVLAVVFVPALIAGLATLFVR